MCLYIAKYKRHFLCYAFRCMQEESEAQIVRSGTKMKEFFGSDAGSRFAVVALAA